MDSLNHDEEFYLTKSHVAFLYFGDQIPHEAKPIFVLIGTGVSTYRESLARKMK